MKKMMLGNILSKMGIKKNRLIEEEAEPNSFSVRQPWDSSQVASVLDPETLATLVGQAINGDAHDYLTLAEEMEERDLHYRSVLGTRKHAIEALDRVIEPASDNPQDIEIAEEISRDLLKKPEFAHLVKNALDGLGKGYSVNEIIWKTSAEKWIPCDYKWRDPRWFEYDRETGRRLLLRSGAGAEELTPYKYIIHEPQLKSGLPIRSGLALSVAYYFLIKNYDVTGWAAFCEVFGYPIRLGKYDGRKASEKDKAVLKSAIRNLGRDVGAVIPKSMEIEIVNGVQSNGNIDLFERLANWVDKQVSKGVLGQTMSTDAEGGQYKGDLHNEVRQEIKESDATQLEATLNRDLIRPYVDLNYGVRENYPRLKIPVPKPENIPALVDAIEKLVPLGLAVGTDQIYKKLGLARPDKKDDVLSAPQTISMNTELNRQFSEPTDRLEELVEETESDWMAIGEPVKEALDSLIKECNSFEELQERLPSMVEKLQIENTAEKMALATFKARALGDAEFDFGEE